LAVALAATRRQRRALVGNRIIAKAFMRQGGLFGPTQGATTRSLKVNSANGNNDFA
jgi:hypothetical protein